MISEAKPSGAYSAVLAALDNALVGEPSFPEQRAELDQIMVDIATGRRVVVRNDDAPAWLSIQQN